MRKPIVNQHMAQSITSNWDLSLWPATMINQHLQLEAEIGAIETLVVNRSCTLVQMGVHLKRLIKGVITHLELESSFVSPILTEGDLPKDQIGRLSEGFRVLYDTCYATEAYAQELKLRLGNSAIKSEQANRIIVFLSLIKQRLSDEDAIYAQLSGQAIRYNDPHTTTKRKSNS